MPVDEAPEDEDGSIRQSYNFAPGNHGLVYRADVPDSGASKPSAEEAQFDEGKEAIQEKAAQIDGAATRETRYKLQGMKWGLIPFWTKRQPDYGSMMRTINCRDDSLASSGGMWNTMKQRKRCIVVCEGFYEWQKKNNGKEKIPHFIKRKDGQMMCFAGLWDCVKYEGQEEKLYTYTIITTDSNKQLGWLHDRMPVILEQGSEAIKTWLDPGRAEWSRELQQLMKPYQGELELYPVDKAVGKVGNNSPSFVVPIDSKDNKKNIANFFGAQKKEAKGSEKTIEKTEQDVAKDGTEVKREADEGRETEVKTEASETNAPLPKPAEESTESLARGIKREASDDDIDTETKDTSSKKTKLDDTPPDKSTTTSPQKVPQSSRRTRSATSNAATSKSPVKAGDGSKKITSFFGR